MIENTSQGIQATLFDYFQDTEYFTLQDANELVLEHQNRDVNTESIRARIYEGIDKGLFERVGKGLYTVTRKDEQGRENTCLLINGDGRNLSFLADNSVDAIITDHPYDTKKSLKGGNRDFADYELFQYNEQDFKEKQRVLKPGHFLVEFLPEENGDNYEYLYRIKDMARAAGLEYYAKVPWKKGDFVANTGRKSKNTEDVCFFTKGKARELRPDAKKDKQYADKHVEVVLKDFIPGSTTVSYSDMGGLGSSSETKVEAIDIDIRISVLKEDETKARELLDEAYDSAVIDSYENSPLDIDNGGSFTLEELYDMPVQEYILRYIERSELSFDDVSKAPVEYFMSGAAGMLPTVFDFGIDKKTKIHQAEKPVELLQQILRFVTKEDELVLDQFAGSGSLGEAALKSHRDSILVEKDDDTFNRLRARIEALGEVNVYSDKQQKAVDVVVGALEAHADGPEAYNAYVEYREDSDMPVKDAALKLWDLPREQSDSVKAALEYAKDVVKHETYAAVLECSSRGDKRFSPLYAKVCINGKEKSIEEWFQGAKRTEDGKKSGKGRPFDYIVDPFTGSKLPAKEAKSLYRGLWITYLSKNPDLVKYAEQFDEFTNFYFTGEKLENSHNKIIEAYVKGDRERYVAVVKCSDWYKNMVAQKKSLSEQISDAEKQTAGSGFEREMRRGEEVR